MNSWKFGTIIRGERGDIHMVLDQKDSRHARVLTLVSDHGGPRRYSSSLPPRWPAFRTATIDLRWKYDTWNDAAQAWELARI